MNFTQGKQKSSDANHAVSQRWRKTLADVGVAFLLVAGGAVSAHADLVIPGADGSDGPLTIAANREIDLSEAVTGTWDDPVAAEDAGKGIYDPEKWAVVFKYSAVTVNAGATVMVKNHPSRAPVVWLVNGDVTINGTVSLNGKDYVGAAGVSDPGPGGFRGGMGYYSSGVGGGPGFGPGGAGRW